MDLKIVEYLAQVEKTEQIRLEKYVNANTGEINLVSMFNDELIPNIPIIGKLADRAAGLSLMLRDLEKAKKWMNKAVDIMIENKIIHNKDSEFYLVKDNDLSDEIKPFFIASVTFYGKIFSDAEGRGIKAEKKWLNEDNLELHELLVHLRNNFAAHSGDSKYESSQTYLLLVPIRKKKIVYFPTNIRKQVSMVDVGDKDGVGSINRMNLHFDYVHSVLNEKYMETLVTITKNALGKGKGFLELIAGTNEKLNLDAIKKNKR